MGSVARPVLQGKLVRLRVVAAGDLGNVTAWLGRKKYYAPFAPLANYSRADVRGRFSKGKFDTWFVIESPKGAAVGLAIYYRTPKTDSMSLGLNVAVASARGNGYGTDALIVLSRYVLEHYPDVCWLYAETDASNLGMNHVLQRLGMTVYKTITGPSRHVPAGSRAYYRVSREDFTDRHGPLSSPDETGAD